jgi:hypothetical protein
VGLFATIFYLLTASVVASGIGAVVGIIAVAIQLIIAAIQNDKVTNFLSYVFDFYPEL